MSQQPTPPPPTASKWMQDVVAPEEVLEKYAPSRIKTVWKIWDNRKRGYIKFGTKEAEFKTEWEALDQIRTMIRAGRAKPKQLIPVETRIHTRR